MSQLDPSMVLYRRERACRRFHCNFVRWRFFPYFHGHVRGASASPNGAVVRLINKQPAQTTSITPGLSTLDSTGHGGEACRAHHRGFGKGGGGLLFVRFVRFVRSDSSIQKRREWSGIFVPTPLINGKKINSPSHPRTKRNRGRGATDGTIQNPTHSCHSILVHDRLSAVPRRQRKDRELTLFQPINFFASLFIFPLLSPSSSRRDSHFLISSPSLFVFFATTPAGLLYLCALLRQLSSPPLPFPPYSKVLTDQAHFPHHAYQRRYPEWGCPDSYTFAAILEHSR